jgi:hypothetical protein
VNKLHIRKLGQERFDLGVVLAFDEPEDVVTLAVQKFG